MSNKAFKVGVIKTFNDFTDGLFSEKESVQDKLLKGMLNSAKPHIIKWVDEKPSDVKEMLLTTKDKIDSVLELYENENNA